MSFLYAGAGSDQGMKEAWLEAQTSEWKAAHPHGEEMRIDASGQHAVRDATSRSLFATHRLVRVSVTDEADAGAVESISSAAEDTLHVLLDVRVARTAALKKRVQELGGVWESFPLPDRSTASRRVNWSAEQRHVQLDAKTRALLNTYAAHDVSCVDSALRACELVGLRQPTAAQLSQLLGTGRPAAFAYDLVDKLRNKDLPGALAFAQNLEAPAAVALLTKHFATAAALSEGEGGWDEWAKTAGISSYAKGQAQSSLKAWGEDGVRTRWQACARATPKCRSGGFTALADLVAQLHGS